MDAAQQALHAAVLAHQVADDAERRDRDAVAALVAGTPRCFDRGFYTPGHVTGSAFDQRDDYRMGGREWQLRGRILPAHNVLHKCDGEDYDYHTYDLLINIDERLDAERGCEIERRNEKLIKPDAFFI